MFRSIKRCDVWINVLTTLTYSNISIMAELMRLYLDPLLRKALTTGSNRKFLIMYLL